MLARDAGGRAEAFLDDDILASTARAAAQMAGAAVVGVIATLVWMRPGRGSIPLALVVGVPAMLIVCDLVPRGLVAASRTWPRRRLARILAGPAFVLAPLLLAERVLRLVIGRHGMATPLSALRRLGTWLAARPGRGPLDVSEAGLVVRIVRFAAKTARDAMVPLVDVCSVPDTAPVGQVVALVQERGFSRVPVFHERDVNISGLVTSLDLLGVTEPGLQAAAVMRDPLFVPASKPLPELLATLQAEGRNLAIVVDEYGGAVGLVTIEDLVEEIVGEIEDEYDAPRDLYRRIAPGVYLVSARAPVAEVNERFGWNLPQGEYETLGGLVLERLGRVPKPGDAVSAGRVELVVARATARAVLELRVQERR
jgi:CBS domain containing-hemolysin-like protein